MKNILLPTDFSDIAWNGIVYALNLLKNRPCTFYIVNTYEPSMVSLLATISSHKLGYLYAINKEASEQGLEEIMQDLGHSKISDCHHFVPISKSGDLETVLKEIVQDKSIDLIVMGTKGATGAAAVFWGSTTQKVVRMIEDCPVLVVPEAYTFEGLSEIGFATDFKQKYYKSEIDPLLDLAAIDNGTIRMVHVYNEPKLNRVQEYNSKVLEEYLKKTNYKFHVIADYATVEKAIEAVLEELNVQILVMIKYKHGFIDRLAREPILKKITFHSNIPFLVIPCDT